MNCREFQFDLDEYAMGRLSPERRAAMDSHRATCAACEIAYQQEAGLRAQLREIPLSVLTHDLWHQVSAQINQPVVSARALWKRWTAAALVPAVSFGLLAFFLIPRPQQTLPQSEHSVVLVTPVHEEKVVDNLLDMRRMDVADRDALIEQTMPVR